MLRDRAMLSACGSGAAIADSTTAGAYAWTDHNGLHEVTTGREDELGLRCVRIGLENQGTFRLSFGRLRRPMYE